jgi:type VI secretion system secreted protein VgrG
MSRGSDVRNCGGASVVLEGGNITFHCPGAYTIKAASFTFVGPDNVPTELPLLPKNNYQPGDRYSHSH